MQQFTPGYLLPAFSCAAVMSLSGLLPSVGRVIRGAEPGTMPAYGASAGMNSPPLSAFLSSEPTYGNGIVRDD